MEPSDHRVAIEAEGERIAGLSPSTLGADVPTCPGWSVGALVGHLGGVHRWATSYLAAGPDEPHAKLNSEPPTGAAILDWYRESLDGLLTEIDRHDPAEPTRSFAGPSIVGFWIRRQAHETSMHRWDAENGIAVGRATPIATPLAADGIDEWLTFFVQRFLISRGDGVPAEIAGSSLHLHCTDDALVPGTGEWLLRLTDDRVDVEHAHAKGDAAIRGSASDLALGVWHRKSIAELDVVGDVDVATRILDAIHIG